MLKVRDVMTPMVWSVPKDRMLDQALTLMWEHDLGAVPVVDEKSHVAGMITDRDIAMATLLRGRQPREIGVAETVSRGVATCHPDDPISTAADVMCQNQVRRVPVTDAEGKPVGMITLADLARAAATGAWDGGQAGVLRTLSAVAEPRASTPPPPPKPSRRARGNANSGASPAS